MIDVLVYGPFTAATLTLAGDLDEAVRITGADAKVRLAPICGEPMKTDLGPLPSCCLPAGHDGDHDPYGRPT